MADNARTIHEVACRHPTFSVFLALGGAVLSVVAVGFFLANGERGQTGQSRLTPESTYALSTLKRDLDAARQRIAELEVEVSNARDESSATDIEPSKSVEPPRDERLTHLTELVIYGSSAIDDFLDRCEADLYSSAQTADWLRTLEGYLAYAAAINLSDRESGSAWLRLARCQALINHPQTAETCRRAVASLIHASASSPSDKTINDELIAAHMAAARTLLRQDDPLGAASSWRLAAACCGTRSPTPMDLQQATRFAACDVGMAAAYAARGETARADECLRLAREVLSQCECLPTAPTRQRVEFARMCLRACPRPPAPTLDFDPAPLLQRASTALAAPPDNPEWNAVVARVEVEMYDASLSAEQAAGNTAAAAVACKKGLAALGRLPRLEPNELLLAGKFIFFGAVDAEENEEQLLARADALIGLGLASATAKRPAAELRAAVLRRSAALHRYRGDNVAAERELRRAVTALEATPPADGRFDTELARLQIAEVEALLSSGAAARADRLADELSRRLDEAATPDREMAAVAVLRARCCLAQAEALRKLGDRTSAEALAKTAMEVLDRSAPDRKAEAEKMNLKARAHWFAAEDAVDVSVRLQSAAHAARYWDQASAVTAEYDRVHRAAALLCLAEEPNLSGQRRIELANLALTTLEPKPEELFSRSHKAQALDLRAAARMEQNDLSGALDDWQAAALTVPQDAWRYRLNEAKAGLKSSDETLAATAADDVRNDRHAPPAAMFEAARVYALAAKSLRDRAEDGFPVDETREDQYIAKAFEALETARQRGVFDSQAAVRQLDSDPDFILVRGRLEYLDFIDRFPSIGAVE